MQVNCAGETHCKGWVCYFFLPFERHAVCSLTLQSVYVEEGYESNLCKISELYSDLMVQAKSKHKIPIVGSPQETEGTAD